MSDMKEAMREAQSHIAWLAREQLRHKNAIGRENAYSANRIAEKRKALSPAAARIVVAAEQQEQEPEPHPPLVMAMKEAMDSGAWPTPDPNPVPDWMNREPPPLAPGSLIEVEHKAKARRS